MALTLYFHPLSSFCHKVLIALYEKEIAFTAKLIELGDPAAREAFLKLWPTGKIPLLLDDSNARVVPETTIIIEYLDQHYSGARPLLPQDGAALLDARLWDRLFDLYVMMPMQKVVGDRFRAQGQHDPVGVAEAIATLRMAYGMIEQHMANRTWAAGEEFSIADCSAAPALFYGSIVEPFPAHTRLADYFERLIRRPSVKRTLAQARPWFHLFPLKDSIPARFVADQP
jgi:glutathione S-transferase